MRVRVTYATITKPHQNLNPYDPMTLEIVGDAETVACWLDEHFVPSDLCLSGEGHLYVQGQERPSLLLALQTNDTYTFGAAGTLKIERLPD